MSRCKKSFSKGFKVDAPIIYPTHNSHGYFLPETLEMSSPNGELQGSRMSSCKNPRFKGLKALL